MSTSTEAMNTAQPMYGWEHLPWKTMERAIFKLQKRIYQASLRGDIRTVHTLQRLLMKSWAAKCLAVRRISQDNQGKKTAGIDGMKSLKPQQRLTLAKLLTLQLPVKPARRIWIPKPGTQEKRPLGIPTMVNRAQQSLVKLALEPEWESKFEPNSYGFRPGRSAHDAMREIYIVINQAPKYVLDADIAKCFDRINHDALLKKVATFPSVRRVIKSWLKAGVVEEHQLFPTTEGTPQGGVMSPLLANIALHGLENTVREAFPGKTIIDGKVVDNWKPVVLRYADDFLVFHRELAVIEATKQIIVDWLKDMGLELKPSKTRITHTLHRHEENWGFDFLGFHVGQYEVGKTHGRTSGGPHHSRSLGFKTIIQPSPESLKRHMTKLHEVIKEHQARTQRDLIGTLNPIIRGWSNYYSRVSANQSFAKVDHVLWRNLWQWAKRRHPNKTAKWKISRYWSTGRGKWEFRLPDGEDRLLKHAWTSYSRHVKVQGTRSPFDGDWSYWGTRMGSHPDLPMNVAKLLKRQRGKCALCGLYFREEDVMEIDHIIPISQGGEERYQNMQLLHRHCHDRKTAEDNSAERGAHVKGQPIEEPYDAKVSRTVLKTSR